MAEQHCHEMKIWYESQPDKENAMKPGTNFWDGFMDTRNCHKNHRMETRRDGGPEFWGEVEGATFLCGAQVPRKSDLKTVRNFAKFLQGKGSRCPECCHKMTKHWTSCTARGCGCWLDSSGVLAVRAQLKCPGWERDE